MSSRVSVRQRWINPPCASKRRIRAPAKIAAISQIAAISKNSKNFERSEDFEYRASRVSLLSQLKRRAYFTTYGCNLVADGACCAMRETSTERSRRHRWRKRNGIAAVMVNVELRKLIAAGLLREKASKQKSRPQWKLSSTTQQTEPIMLQHGRKSQQSFMMSGVTDVNWPPQPPANISAKAQREWRDVTSNLSADAMPRECLPLLAVWCAVKTELDDVMLALMRDHDTRLVRMRSALAREFGQLSSRLRLTPAARLDAHRSPRADTVKPWSTRSASASEHADNPASQQRAPRGNGDGKPWGESEVASEDDP